MISQISLHHTVGYGILHQKWSLKDQLFGTLWTAPFRKVKMLQNILVKPTSNGRSTHRKLSWSSSNLKNKHNIGSNKNHPSSDSMALHDPNLSHNEAPCSQRGRACLRSERIEGGTVQTSQQYSKAIMRYLADRKGRKNALWRKEMMHV